MPTIKLVRFVPYHSRFRKVFTDYDLILGPTAPSVAYDLDSSTMIQLPCILPFLTFPANLAGLQEFRFCWILHVYLSVCRLIGPGLLEETIYQAAAAFEATTDYQTTTRDF